MFFAIALFVVGFIATAVLAPKAKVENARPAALSDFSFPRADEGDPVPRWYGTLKFKAPNTIWRGGFKAVPIKKKQKTGIFSSKKVTVGYKYYITLDLAVCLGPRFTFRRLWAGKHELWNGCLLDSDCASVISINMPNLFGGKDKLGGFVGDIALYCGKYDQPHDAYIQAQLDGDDLYPAYPGVAHLVLRNCYIGNSPQIEPIYIEGSLFPTSLDPYLAIMDNGLDANPVCVLHQIYTDDWANLGIDPSLIDDAQWMDIATRVKAEGNGISIVVSNPNSGADVTKEILRQINATLYQNPSTGLFELVLIRGDYDVADLPVFGPGQIKEVTNFTKKLWEQTNNRVRVKYVDREQDYKEGAVAIADDFANIRFQKKIRAAEISMPLCYDPDLANSLAARELSNLNVPLYQADIVLDREAALLGPGEPFVWHWPEYGIQQMVVRVRKHGLGTFKDGTVVVSVVQDEFALDKVVMGPPTNVSTPSIGLPPGEVQPLWLELPYWLAAASELDPAEPHLAILAKAPTPASTGYNAIVSPAGEDPVELLEAEGYTMTATLAEPFDRWAGFVNGFYAGSIWLANVTDDTLLRNMAPENVREGQNLFMLNGELLTYATTAVEVDGRRTITGIRRAIADTDWQGGEVGDTVYFFDGQEGFLPQAGGFEGQLQDITTNSIADLDLVPTIVAEPEGRAALPLAPDMVKINGLRVSAPFEAGDTVTVDWVERNRLTNPAVLKFEDDPAEAAEGGTLYQVQLTTWDGDTIVAADDVAGTTTPVTLTDAMAGNGVLSVWAKRNGVLSFTGAPYPVTVLGGALWSIDSAFVTIDGEEVEIN